MFQTKTAFKFSKRNKCIALKLLLVLERGEQLNPTSAFEDLNGCKMSVTNLSGVITPNSLHTGLKHISCKANLQMRPQHSHLYKTLPRASVPQIFICCFLQRQYFLAVLQLQVPKHISDVWTEDKVMKRYSAARWLSSHYTVFIVENIINVWEKMTTFYLAWNCNRYSNRAGLLFLLCAFFIFFFLVGSYG